jgi:hypothetical protein
MAESSDRKPWGQNHVRDRAGKCAGTYLVHVAGALRKLLHLGPVVLGRHQYS